MSIRVPSITGGQVEKFYPADRVTHSVQAAAGTVRGGRIVEATANREVREAPAGSLKTVGLAMYDGDATGITAPPKISVATEGAWFLLATGAIGAGDRLEAAAAGTVRTLQTVDAAGSFDPRALIAVAYEAIANGVTGPCKLVGF